MRVEKLCMPKILMVGIDLILQWQCKSPLQTNQHHIEEESV